MGCDQHRSITFTGKPLREHALLTGWRGILSHCAVAAVAGAHCRPGMELAVSCLSSLTVRLNDINSIKELESAVFPGLSFIFFPTISLY